eukprot:g65630.t1
MKTEQAHVKELEQLRVRLREQDCTVRVKLEKLCHAEAQSREQAIKHKQQLQTAQQDIQALRKGLDAKENTVEELRETLTCCICFEAEISRVYLPCGHCSCENEHWQVGQLCPKCKQAINNRLFQARFKSPNLS